MKSIFNKSLALFAGALLIASCSKQATTINLPAPTPIEYPTIEGPAKIYNSKTGSTALFTKIYVDGSTELKIDKPSNSTVQLKELTEEEQMKASTAFAKYLNNGTSYGLLPADLIEVELKDGSPATLSATVHNIPRLPYGDYLYPVAIDVAGTTNYHFFHVVLEPEFTPISDKFPKPLPADTFGGATPKSPIKMVAYVETNDWDPRNMANFVLESSKQPVFDMVVLFAANMNWNAVDNKRYIHFNSQLQTIINNPDTYIRPLTDRGIKVIIDILPNHQGVGYANFQSYEEAVQFAQEAKEWTDKLGIDGWDIDEEYASYWNLPQYPTNDNSWLWFAKAMKEVMPDKILTLYDYAHGYRRDQPDSDGKYAADYIDYSWADYGSFQTSYAGIPNERYGSQSIEASHGQLTYGRTRSIATNNLKNNFGLLMIFNIVGDYIKNGSAARSISGATEIYYGQKTIFEGKYYPGPKEQ